jgi:hypothetical protein
MNAFSLNMQYKFTSPPVTPTQLISRCLTHHDKRWAKMADQVPCAQASNLFLNDSRYINISGRADPLTNQSGNSVDLGGQWALDVHGSPTADSVGVDFSAKGRMGPSGAITDIHVVQVGVEHHCGSCTQPTK